MGSIDVASIRKRARRAYELGRVRLSLVGILPVLLIAAVAAALAIRPASTLVFGGVTVLLGAALLWYGRDPQKAVLPGVAAGLAPLALSLCASRVHACGASGCGTLCVPACALGGVVAALALARVVARRGAGFWFFGSASALCLLTGAMGCACLGYSGVIGLLVGFGVGSLPGLVRRASGSV
ncbi:MAG: hypothetical protein DIU78_007390 [Pseudomonadota bacterium]|nr:MAG: hypothetical protein DIU78_12035 [Pseudomonadota bacterium]